MSLITLTRMPIPLNREAHAYATQFAAEQATPIKGKQVYLNTLAVYAVHTYLNWLEIPTDLQQSDCWRPGLRAMFDIADLVVPEVGVLECRPILPGAQNFTVPLEATENRLGYVAVQFQENLHTVELLGFERAEVEDSPQPLEIPLDNLSLNPLLNLLHSAEAIEDLRQWLQGYFRDKWRPVDELLPVGYRNAARPVNLSSGFSVPADVDAQVRSVSRAMEIVLEPSGRKVILVVQLVAITTTADSVNVILRLYPDPTAPTLPRNLTITVLDQSNSVVLTAQASSETLPELVLNCHPGEQFSVRIALGAFNLTETFSV